MGYSVIALSTGDEKKDWCLANGASVYVNASAEKDVVSALLKATGEQGVSAVLATGSSAAATSQLVGALGVNGVVLTLGVGADCLSVHPGALIHNNRSLRGWGSGSPQDNEETLEFAAKFGIHPVIQKYELKDAQKAYDDMNSNKLRYRAVIVSPKSPEK
jgi:D-arabinose 1-dehydrogenase-like Zn-dependent alcohol dehydrogenase